MLGVEISKGGRGRERSAAPNDAGLSEQELASVHQIPFMLALPAAASFPRNNGPFLFIVFDALISGMPLRRLLALPN